ncbi:MAG: GNAT family N-acetyltransferase [Anaeromyxobacter sp.]
MPYLVRFASRPEDLDSAFALRRHVFEVEKSVPRPMFPDSFDSIADHAVAYGPDGRCVGTGRAYRLDARTFRIGRQVVAPDVRGSGVGSALLEALERIAELRGVRELVVHAQLAAEPWYAKRGYEPEGSVFDEAGTTRRRLRKVITPHPLEWDAQQ